MGKHKHITTWGTYGLIVLTLVLFASYVLIPKIVVNDVNTASFGAPYAVQIYNGQYWGLLTNSFLHITPIHFIANIIPFYFLSVFIERRMKSFYLLLIIITASITTSIWQLTLSNDAGTGLSGVNLFLLCFIIGKGLTNKAFRIHKTYIALLPVALVFLIVFKYMFYFNIGIGALISGTTIGFLIGRASEFDLKKNTFKLYSTCIFVSMIILFYSPWSAEWQYSKGYKLHMENKLISAEKFYIKAIKLDKNHVFAVENLKILRVEKISNQAYLAHKNENFSKAKKLYHSILKIEPTNYWAKSNLKKLAD